VQHSEIAWDASLGRGRDQAEKRMPLVLGVHRQFVCIDKVFTIHNALRKGHLCTDSIMNVTCPASGSPARYAVAVKYVTVACASLSVTKQVICADACGVCIHQVLVNLAGLLQST
jgi:hypothetical protein